MDGTTLGLIVLMLGGIRAPPAASRRARSAAPDVCKTKASISRSLQSRFTPEAHALMDQQGFLDMGGTLLGKAFIESAARLDPLSALKNYRGAAWICHGDADPTVPIFHAHDYANALPEWRASTSWAAAKATAI